MKDLKKIHIIMLLHHLESLRIMSRCLPMPYSQASEEIDRTADYFYYDNTNPRKCILESKDSPDTRYPVLYFGCDCESLDFHDNIMSKLYMESMNELDGLHIDVVFSQNDGHDSWHLQVYDDDYLNGLSFDSVMFMDGEMII